MHDPLTVAFEIRYPWRQRGWRKYKDEFSRTYHQPFITIWHKDPETDGTDDSCDWFWRKFNAKEQARLNDLVTNPDDNIRHWFAVGDEEPNDYVMERIVAIVAAHARRVTQRRPWWDTPRWHFWHYRIQMHPGQRLKRWLFTRCATCGNRFEWNESPCALGWHEKAVHHMRCVGMEVAQTAAQ